MTVNTQQLRLIQSGLEILGRMKSGQASISLSEAYPELDWDQREDIEDLIRKYAFPELTKNQYYGVGCKDRPDIANSFDIVQVIRHRLSWDRLEAEGKDKPDFYGVHYNKPMKFGQYDLPELKNE